MVRQKQIVPRRRKTNSNRRQEWLAADRRVWEQFRPKLEALSSFPEAQSLVIEAPPPNSPGRRYYSNLDFFLGTFAVPAGSNFVELSLYLQFIRRLDTAGTLKPGIGKNVQEAIQHAMNACSKS
jgi:hypothetical protein